MVRILFRARSSVNSLLNSPDAVKVPVVLLPTNARRRVHVHIRVHKRAGRRERGCLLEASHSPSRMRLLCWLLFSLCSYPLLLGVGWSGRFRSSVLLPAFVNNGCKPPHNHHKISPAEEFSARIEKAGRTVCRIDGCRRRRVRSKEGPLTLA